MDCFACKASNPDVNQFCGRCGNPLDAAALALSRQVDTLVVARLKDHVVIESEISDRVLARLTAWLNAAANIFKVAGIILVAAGVIAAFFGFRTYYDAATAIKTAADTAVKDVNTKATQAEATIASAAQNVQEKLEEANQTVASVIQGANENKAKLAQLEQKRKANPGITLGELPAQSVTPSAVGAPRSLTATILDGQLPSTFHGVTLGARGDDVKKLQTALQQRDCYAGTISGLYDQSTASAMVEYRRAKIGNPTAYFVDSSVVDEALFNEITSPAVGVRCAKR